MSVVDLAHGPACGPPAARAHAAAQRTVKGEPRKDVGSGRTAEVKPEKKDKKFLQP